MTTILVYFVGFCLFVALTMVIPGLSTLVTPVWAGIGRGFLLFIGWSWGWVVYVIKRIVSAHAEVGRNLIFSGDKLDVRRRIKK